MGSTHSDTTESRLFLLVGECADPWMTIKVVETDYDDDLSENKYVNIYANEVFLGQCLGLNHDCTHDWVTCANVFYYNLTSIMSLNSSNACFTNDCDSSDINVIDIAFNIKTRLIIVHIR